jgi:hypothetical protein
MKTRNIILILIAAVSLASAQFEAWTDSARILVNSTSGAGGTGDVTDFPVLVRLDSSFFTFGDALAGGADLRFSKTDGTALPYEIELWDSASGEAAVWVKMDTIYATDPQTLMMYWGNSSAEDSSNAQAVFETSHGFGGVWHMNDDPAGDAADAVKDITANGFHGTPVGAMTSADLVDGIVGQSIDFDGSDDHLDLGTMDADLTGGVTLCGWMNYDGFNWWSRLMDCGLGASDNVFFIGNRAASDDARWENWGPSSGGTVDVDDVFIQDAWVHVCGTIGADGAMEFYKNGESVGSVNGANPGNVARSSCYIGKSNWGGDQAYDGQTDEVRLSTVARSADWIALNYATQREGNLFVSQPVASGCTDSFSVAMADTVEMNESDTLTLTGIADCGFFPRWSRVEGVVEHLIGNGLTADITPGRIRGNDTVTVRFSSLFDAGVQTHEMVVIVLETVPDPVFTLPSLGPWGGEDSIIVQPTITNLDDITASSAPDINYAWTVADVNVVSREDGDDLVLRYAWETGTLNVQLCLDNGDSVNCQSTTIEVNGAIPSPVVSVTDPTGTWNGLDTLYVIAEITNLADIQASPEPDVHNVWTTSGVIVSRTPMGDTLMVRNARESGTLNVKLCADNNGPVVCDSVDITVEVQDPITVLTPNGGEELTGGTVYNVTWESIPTITQIHVQYQLDGGSWSTAAINQENTGTYAWTVPNTPSTSALLRVVSATGGLLDVSDAPFTIVAGTSVDAYRNNEGIVFQIKGLDRIRTGGYNYQRLEVLDLNGGLVAELAITGSRVTWDLESNGSRAASGIYLVRLIGKNKTSEFKVLVD